MQVNKVIFPLVLILSGLSLLLYSFGADQNLLFKLGSTVILLTGIITFMSVGGVFTKSLRTVISFVVAVICAVLLFFDYNSIQKPLEFKEEMDAKYSSITQRLKDIREAQKTFKNVHKRYAPTFDTLIAFIDTGKVPVLKAFGNIPDGLTEEEAIAEGYYKKEILTNAKCSK